MGISYAYTKGKHMPSNNGKCPLMKENDVIFGIREGNLHSSENYS